jgi:inosine-uridine preferring nucleoside hydrolase
VRWRIGAVVAMGGAVEVPGNIGRGHERVEFNLWVDPVAAAQVLRSGVPVTLVPLDATNQVPVTNAFAGALKTHRRAGPAAQLAWRLFARTGMFAGGQYFWDPLAAAAIATPGVLDVRPRRLTVDTAAGPDQGRSRSDADGARVRVAVDADRAAFENDLLATLTGRPGVRVPQPRGPAALTYDGRDCRWPAGPAGGPAGPESSTPRRPASERSRSRSSPCTSDIRSPTCAPRWRTRADDSSRPAGRPSSGRASPRRAAG